MRADLKPRPQPSTAPASLLLAMATAVGMATAPSPVSALQLVEARDGVSVEAMVSIKEPTRIRIDGAPITARWWRSSPASPSAATCAITRRAGAGAIAPCGPTTCTAEAATAAGCSSAWRSAWSIWFASVSRPAAQADSSPPASQLLVDSLRETAASEVDA